MENNSYVNKRLDLWFHEQNPVEISDANKYKTKLSYLFNYMKEHIYPQIGTGAIWSTICGGKEPVYLNDHGENHVNCVILRITDILQEAKWQLTFYETYILLAAIYLHDAGNVLGRESHESKCFEILHHIGTSFGEDTAEKKIISKIAAAHGGTVNGSKDTISCLRNDYPILGRIIRKQVLAALLRFGDELADDMTRASRFLLENATKKQFLQGSEIFHIYSQSLRSVNISEKDVMLSFDLDKDMVLDKCWKLKKQVYLLDEIFERTQKMYYEMVYCMRFLKPKVRLESINVDIEVWNKKFKKRLHQLTYSIKEKGYPFPHKKGIYGLCPELRMINGQRLKEEIQSLSGSKKKPCPRNS